jgi:hypothetical protein
MRIPEPDTCPAPRPDHFAAFDLQVSYDRRDHSAEVSVALIPELLEPLAEDVSLMKDRPVGPVRVVGL